MLSFARGGLLACLLRMRCVRALLRARSCTMPVYLVALDTSLLLPSSSLSYCTRTGEVGGRHSGQRVPGCLLMRFYARISI